MFDEYLWLCISFAIFVYLFVRIALPKISAILGAKSEEIRNKINDIHVARENAFKNLQAAKEILARAEIEAEITIRNAKIEAENIIKNTIEMSEKKMKDRLISAERNIKSMEDGAVNEIREIVIRNAIIKIKEEFHSEDSNKDIFASIFDKSVENLKKLN